MRAVRKGFQMIFVLNFCDKNYSSYNKPLNKYLI